ncbi:hypothetical protein LXA43DRAFT_244707 [Ganoderma leucocontextum]|nr:hypothetical protein LXA43DRAFT_244707 [Ganoderma leucocontextum]
MDSLLLVQDVTTPLIRLPTLPTEVVEEVIDQASDNSASLRQLSLLCKSLLTRSRFHLFTRIVIRDAQQMESSREFLDSHPWVRPLVQKVTLSSDLSEEYSKPNMPLLDIIRLHLFTQLPNLRAWSMSTWLVSFRPHPWLSFHRSTLLCYRIYGSCIQNLELAGIPLQDVSHFARLISAFTSLHSLMCYNVWVRKEDQTSLHDSEILSFKLAKPLKIRHSLLRGSFSFA